MEANDFIRANYENMSDKEIALALGMTETSVKNRRQRMKLTKPQQGVRQPNDNAEVQRVASLIVKAMNEAGADIAEIEKVRYSKWQQGIKNSDGEFEAHDLEGINLLLDPAWKTGPKWPVVQQAQVVNLKPLKKSPNKTQFKTAVILPDPQIGFLRDIRTDELIPFHDEQAIECALRLIERVNPDLIVNLGDFLDFAQFGRFIQQPGFALTVQKAINKAHEFLVQQRTLAPNAHIVLIEGNHDMRLQTSIISNAQAAFGIQRANVPEEWPVMSIPYLLRLDEIGVEYVGGYPAGHYYINDRLKCVHGHKVRSSTSTARAVIDDERVSTIFGHVHRIEVQYKTTHVRSGARISLAVTPGCLCRIDGTVPSTKGGVDPFGRPLTSYENWQQGLAVVHYAEGDGEFAVTPVFIHEGHAIYNGVIV